MMRFLVLGLVCAVATSAVTSYHGHPVLRVSPTHGDFKEFLAYCDEQQLDIWEIAQNDNTMQVDVHVSPVEQENFFGFLSKLAIPYETYITDIQALIDLSATLRQNATENQDPFFDNYRRLADIRAKTVALANSRADASFFVLGQTNERRDIFGIRFGGQFPGPLGRRAVYLQGGIHAREWIAPASVMFIMDALVTSTDPAVINLVNQLEFVIVPVLNADGYEFTHTNTRLWRKNRRVNQGSTCIGVDLNRNWEDHWGGGGSSNLPCSDVYRGARAASEPETQAVVDFLATLNRQTTLIGGIDYHAFGQLILRPYGWCLPREGTCMPENNVEMRDLGAQMRSAILASTNTPYSNEHSAQLYIAAGGADDWFYSVATSRRLAYCFEARDQGRFGFVLPPAQIRPTGQELLAATLVFSRHALQRRD